MIRKEICEQIQRRLANGTPSNDFEPSLSEINSWLDAGVASAAMRNYTDSASLDVEFIADAFTATYKIAISKDETTGYYKGTLPAVGLAVPRGYDITSVNVVGSGVLSKPMIRVTPQQLDYYKDLPMPPESSFFWSEANEIFIESAFFLVGRQLSVRMVGSAGHRKLADEFRCPTDYLPMVIEWVYAKFVQNPPKDYSTDGINKA